MIPWGHESLAESENVDKIKGIMIALNKPFQIENVYVLFTTQSKNVVKQLICN